MADEREQIADFIERHGITAHVVDGPTPAVDDDGGRKWPHVKWAMELRTHHGATIRTPWKPGVGNYRPTDRVRKQAERIQSGNDARYIGRKINDGTTRRIRFTPAEAAIVARKNSWLGSRDAQTEASAAAKLAELLDITPNACDILNSLRLDAESAVNAGDFETFAADFGYDTDSRRAERMYRDCLETANRLQGWIGPRAYAELLECEGL